VIKNNEVEGLRKEEFVAKQMAPSAKIQGVLRKTLGCSNRPPLK